MSDWDGSCSFRPVGRPDIVRIKPPLNHIILEPNKTIAGRTVTGRVGCKYCKSHDVVKNGTQKGKQRYICKSCGRQFEDNGHFPKMKNNAKAMSVAMEAYFDGLSLAKIVNLLKRAYGIIVNRSTVWRWIQKYVPLVKRLVEKFNINATSSLHADETAIKIKGRQHWFWDGIDYDTRFIVMGMLTRARTIPDAKRFFLGVKAQIGGNAPEHIVTDGCGAYRYGITKAFWRKVLRGETTYFKKVGLRARIGKMSNNVIERFHNTLKDRVKTLRGFGSKDGARNALDGFVIQYNFLRNHTTLGKTPAQATGLDLPIEKGWGDFIQWAAQWQMESIASTENRLNNRIPIHTSNG
jgi:transposase-like protein